jgi:pilus assembly protein Flp/PilA
MGFIARLGRDARGATAVEYALILSLMVLAMVGGLALVADTTTGMWNGVAQNVVEATN